MDLPSLLCFIEGDGAIVINGLDGSVHYKGFFSLGLSADARGGARTRSAFWIAQWAEEIEGCERVPQPKDFKRFVPMPSVL